MNMYYVHQLSIYYVNFISSKPCVKLGTFAYFLKILKCLTYLLIFFFIL